MFSLPGDEIQGYGDGDWPIFMTDLECPACFGTGEVETPEEKDRHDRFLKHGYSGLTDEELLDELPPSELRDELRNRLSRGTPMIGALIGMFAALVACGLAITAAVLEFEGGHAQTVILLWSSAFLIQTIRLIVVDIRTLRR